MLKINQSLELTIDVNMLDKSKFRINVKNKSKSYLTIDVYKIHHMLEK